MNPAIGGHATPPEPHPPPALARPAPEPDLVTIFFGGNDWDAGMRGEEFARACEDAVDRVRRATRGKADVLLITTNPTATRWTETAELAEGLPARGPRAGTAVWPTRNEPSTRREATIGIISMWTTGCTSAAPVIGSWPKR